MTSDLKSFLQAAVKMLQTIWMEWFLFLAGAMVFFLGLANVLGALSHVQSLNLADPLLGVSFRQIMLVLGICQLALSFILLFTRWQTLGLGLTAWIALNFLIYRAGLWNTGWHQSSGFMVAPIGLSLSATDILFSMSSVFLFLGSCITLWIERKVRLASDFLKMPCPACGGRIRFAFQNLGQQIPCPHCKANVMLRAAGDTVKTSCYFCKGHIEFPAHALGRKVQCPHCAMDITLKSEVYDCQK